MMNLPLKRYFDKSLSSSWWKQLLCLAGILVVFFIPSLLFALFCTDFKIHDAVEVYMDPGNFSSKVNAMYVDGCVPEGHCANPDHDAVINFERNKNFRYWAFLITAFAGAAAFAGVLISMCGNYVQQRVGKYRKGHVRYDFRNHTVILGCNDMVPTLIRQIVGDEKEKFKGMIVLMTSHDVEAVREQLFTDLDVKEQDKIVLVHGNRLSAEDLKNICVSKAKRIYLIGEDDDIDHDTLNINSLGIIAKQIPENRKIGCVTYLRNRSTFALFQTSDIMNEVKKKIDFQPFNFDETWARKLFVNCESKVNGINYPSLDRDGIDKDSDKYVHLIIVGMTQMGVMLGMEAAHICHFPNFITKRRKTKITFIDENADAEMKFLVGANNRFFENCRYKYRYKNHEVRSNPNNDFLDVMFEFFKGNIGNEWIRGYIEECANNDREILTIASCMDDTAKSLAAGLYLPDAVYDKGLSVDGRKEKDEVVVLVRQNTSAELLNIIKKGNAKYRKYRNVYPFGMLNDGCELDETLTRWAKRINYLYCVFDDLGGAPSLYPDDVVDGEWNGCSVSDKWSNIYNAMTIPTKLRSVGVDYKSLICRSLTEEEIGPLAEVEHNRWNVERLLMGYRPVTEKESDEIEKSIAEGGSLKKDYKNRLKAHYDIRPFADLRDDKNGKNVNRYDFGMTKGIIDIIKN
ncbi:MAG: DUF2152 domain-containing protein [Bacteroidales bacterium]|nr:DUF2152 domain-containing protein [Bacteroidales bacterium]